MAEPEPRSLISERNLHMEMLETILHLFINYAILLFEYIGVGVITFAGIQGIVNYVRRVPETRLLLAKGLAMGLEFKLGSEILRTVVVRSLDEIYIVAAIIALRSVLTILIHWEIKNEENEEKMHIRMQRENGRVEQEEEAEAGAAKAAAETVVTAAENAAAAKSTEAAPQESEQVKTDEPAVTEPQAKTDEPAASQEPVAEPEPQAKADEPAAKPEPQEKA